MRRALPIIAIAILLGAALRAEEALYAGLTDRELAIQRWFSQLTFLSDRKAAAWEGWNDDGRQKDITAFRYQIAFCGYGCAAMAAKTPAYTQVIGAQLLDLCERIIDARCWPYVTDYWKYGGGPPDPCRYENVMYTGHLAQLMLLYELMTGDMRYSKEGWDFVWTDGRKTHYDLDLAVRRMHVQSVETPCGGICCEPNSIFADCNNHSSNAYLLHDLLHGTEYSKVNQKWFDWMSKNFRRNKPGSPEFLYVIYLKNQNVFLPLSDVGADGWALGWGYPWFPDTGFAVEGWRYLLKNAKWGAPKPDQAFAHNNKVVACCGGSTLPVANSFLPLVAMQAGDEKNARKILNWLEAECGRSLDADGDGHAESYCYHTCNAHRIPATGNISAALSTRGDSMRRLYRTRRDDVLKSPRVSRVDYPKVLVRSAEFRAPKLRFAVLKGAPSFNGVTKIVCGNIPDNAEVAVTRDGQLYADAERKGTTLIIRTDVEQERVFEVTVR
ncbi:MAG TPA: hypothetical protein PL033_02720 [Candidatus Brocadiia bacterium]|nr:hypothetical protein [Candidatus Brocadiia bacterium]